MKKALLILLGLILSFSLGIFATSYAPVQDSIVAPFFSHLFKGQPIPLQIDRKFNGVLFYATDRKVNPKQSNDYLNLPSSQLTYGTIKINIPDTFRMGDRLSSGDIEKTQPLSTDQFISLLKQQADKPFIIWVHGYNTSVEANTLYFGQIAHDLNMDAVFLSFDWASSASPLAYLNDVQQLDASAKLFTPLIKKIVMEVKPKRIIIISHSLGSKFVAMIFDELYKDPNFKDPDTEFSDVVFIAPNVDRDDFDQNFKMQLMNLVRHLTVYVSSDDNALLLSRLLYNINSLGLPPNFSDTTNLDEIQALLYYQKGLPHRVDIVDVSYFPKRGLTQHLYFKERPVMEDIHWLLNSSYRPQYRYLLKQTVNPDRDISYWFIPP